MQRPKAKDDYSCTVDPERSASLSRAVASLSYPSAASGETDIATSADWHAEAGAALLGLCRVRYMEFACLGVAFPPACAAQRRLLEHAGWMF